MKIGTISDLHLSRNEIDDYASKLVAVAINKQIDLLLIAGDISEDVIVTKKFIKKVNESLKTLYVPGNHDMWNNLNTLTTAQINEMYTLDANCLLNKKYEVNEQYTIIGHIGWYDYSLGAVDKYTTEQFDTMTIDKRTWRDKNYNEWTEDNINKCYEINNQIEQLINSTNKNIILLTHMISNPNFKVLFDEKRKNKGFFNAFLGSDKLYRLTFDHKIKYAICGHVHYRKQICENQTKYICPCLGTKSEWTNYDNDITLENQIDNCLVVFEI